MRRLIIVMSLGVIALLYAPALLPGQTTEGEVHIVPGEGSEAKRRNDRATVDPSLKTNTKPLKVTVDLVLVPVSVCDPIGRLVTGLEKENFQILDDRQSQEIKHFTTEDTPMSLGVIFDMSGSMVNKIEKAREAVVEFFKTANLQDEFFMIAFNDKPDVISEFTRSIEDIQGKLIYTVPRRRTALMDAIYLGIKKMRDAQNARKALLIISDGGDNNSRYTDRDINRVVKEADLQIYAIGIFEPFPTYTRGSTRPTPAS